ncbi:MAG: energy transducer TonB [Melioribacteraceae bacterium]|nr:energy transducer TonB [Melioribacteraceae bacterium]
MKTKILNRTIILSLCAFIISAENIVTGKNLLPGEEDYVVFAEKMPAPVGGVEAIMKKIKYPPMAQKAGIEGKVYILIYINESGGVDDTKVVKGIGGGCDEEAADVIKGHKFSPAEHNGAAVKSKLSLAIQFKLK